MPGNILNILAAWISPTPVNINSKGTCGNIRLVRQYGNSSILCATRTFCYIIVPAHYWTCSVSAWYKCVLCSIRTLIDDSSHYATPAHDAVVYYCTTVRNGLVIKLMYCGSCNDIKTTDFSGQNYCTVTLLR